jgi:hypothetical protein
MRQDACVYFVRDAEKEVAVTYFRILFGHLRHSFLYICRLYLLCRRLKVGVAGSFESLGYVQ